MSHVFCFAEDMVQTLPLYKSGYIYVCLYNPFCITATFVPLRTSFASFTVQFGKPHFSSFYSILFFVHFTLIFLI
jgi:hypothetical protein